MKKTPENAIISIVTEVENQKWEVDAMRKLILFWITWALVWILSMVSFVEMGIVAYKTTGWIIVETIVDIIAAVIFARHDSLTIVGVVIFTIAFIANFSGVMLVCYILSMVLLFVTRKVLRG